MSFEPTPGRILALAFTDIVGSTQAWVTHGTAYAEVLARHDRILREVADRYQGFEAKHTGDGFLFAFESVVGAVAWALESRSRLRDSAVGGAVPVQIRSGVEVGEPLMVRQPSGGIDFFGTPVNRAARIMAEAGPGQLYLGDDAHRLLLSSGAQEIHDADLGLFELKGLGGYRLWQIDGEPIPPRPARVDRRRSNLPPASCKLLGRESEVAEGLATLLSGRRLVTFTGLGGIGKTSLIQDICRRLESERPDGVHWVGCESARSSADVWPLIHQAIGFVAASRDAIAEQVIQHLAGREAILAVDNLEQVADAESVIGRLLQECNGLQIVVSSRRPVGVSEERLVPVGPISSDAGRLLLIERAYELGAPFKPEDESYAHEIAGILGGVPLAIHVVAAWLADLRPRDVVKRLQSLTLGLDRAGGTDRHATVASALGWSFDLLPAEAQNTFADLGTFVGPFEIEAVEAVAGEDALGWFAMLRRNSLVASAASEDMDGYRLLEVVRWYAKEQLSARPDAGRAALGRHAAHFSDEGEARLRKLRGPEEGEAISWFDFSRANLVAAEEWSIGSGESDQARRLSRLLAAHDRLVGRMGDALLRLQRLAGQGDATAEVERVTVMQRLGHHDEVAEECHALLSRPNLAHETSLELKSQLGLALRSVGKYQEARQALMLGIEQLGPLAQTIIHANLLHNLALVEDEDLAGDPGRRDAAALEALGYRRRLGDLRGEAESLTNLGSFCQDSGKHKEAIGHFSRSLELEIRLRHRYGVARALFNLAESMVSLGDAAGAVPLARASLGLFRQLGSRLDRHPAALLESIGSLGEPTLPLASLDGYADLVPASP